MGTLKNHTGRFVASTTLVCLSTLFWLWGHKLLYGMGCFVTGNAVIYRVSEKSGTSGNFNYFSYFYLQVKVKD
jgi:hypothetical protein